MKNLLSLLGTINLIGTSTTSLVACDNITKYTQEQLKELKEENKISINGNTLEWMAPQEKPFNKVDGKWYYILWRNDKNNNWIISKYKNNIELIYNQDIYINGTLFLIKLKNAPNDLVIKKNNYYIAQWFLDKNNNYFKSVYRWNGVGEPNTPIIDSETGKIIYQKKINNIFIRVHPKK